MKKNFEEFLQEEFMKQFTGTKDQVEVAEEHWFEQLDISELIEYGDEYGREVFIEGQKVGIVQGGELATNVVVNKLHE